MSSRSPVDAPDERPEAGDDGDGGDGLEHGVQDAVFFGGGGRRHVSVGYLGRQTDRKAESSSLLMDGGRQATHFLRSTMPP